METFHYGGVTLQMLPLSKGSGMYRKDGMPKVLVQHPSQLIVGMLTESCQSSPWWQEKKKVPLSALLMYAV